LNQASEKPVEGMTDLQKKILKHVCTRKNADYKTLSKATHRDRITVLQSLQSLIKRHLVYQEKTNASRIKSKLLFKPTDKGRAFALKYLGVDLDDIRNAQFDDNERRNYNEFIKHVANPLDRKNNEGKTLKDLLQENLFLEDGNIPDQRLLIQLFRLRLLQFAKSIDPSLEKMFTPANIDKLEAISTQSELKEFKELLTILRNNLDSTIKQLHA
jgi:hypothetical protein